MKSPSGISAGTPLLDNDAPFLVNLNGVAGHEVRVVVHHKKTGVDDAFAGDGNIVQHIGGLLDPCRRIDVASE